MRQTNEKKVSRTRNLSEQPCNIIATLNELINTGYPAFDTILEDGFHGARCENCDRPTSNTLGFDVTR